MSDFRGNIKGFPEEVVMMMLECQALQGNDRDVSVFERNRTACQSDGGFTWEETKDGSDFWYKVIDCRRFDIFFERYPYKCANVLNYQKWE